MTKEEDKLAQRKLIEELTSIFRANGGQIKRYRMGEVNPETPFGPYSAARQRRKKAQEAKRLARQKTRQREEV